MSQDSGEVNGAVRWALGADDAFRALSGPEQERAVARAVEILRSSPIPLPSLRRMVAGGTGASARLIGRTQGAGHAQDR